MNRILSIILALFIGLLVGSLLKLDRAEAQKVNPKDPNTHFYQQKFTLPFKESMTLPIPRQDAPVRIEVSISNIVVSSIYHPMQPVKPMVLNEIVAFDSTNRLLGTEINRSDAFTDEGDIQGLLRVNNEGMIIIETRQLFLNTDHIAQHPFNICVNMWY
jgi:hypothetical protein